MLTKQETLLGRSTRVDGEQRGKGTQENRSATWLTVSGLMVRDQFLGGLWPITLTLGLSWWRTHCPATMDASEDSGRWKSTWCLLLTFPRFFWLLAANTSILLTRTSYCEITRASAYYGA